VIPVPRARSSGGAVGEPGGSGVTDGERPPPLPSGRWDRRRARLSRALPVLRALGFLGAVAIVVIMAVLAQGEVRAHELAAWPLLPAFAAAVAWWLLLARGWAVLVSGRARRPDVAAWCRTQALRYLPGGIWAPASRAVIVRGTVVDKLSTVGAENALALCAALAIAGATLAGAGDLRWLPLVLVLAAPPVAARLVARRTRITPRRTLAAAPGYLTGFGAYAVAAVFVQSAVSGLDEPLAVAGSALVAWSAGLVVVIAPGGLGVRELVYVALLADTLPDTDLVAAAVLLRVVTILAELAVLMVAGRPTLRSRPAGAD
jgi:hypothetical protein